jgi:hypothetical protein
MSRVASHLRPFEITSSGEGKIGITRRRNILMRMLEEYPETEIPILISARLLPVHGKEEKGQVFFDIELDTFEIIGGKSNLAYTEGYGISRRRDRSLEKKKENEP